MAVYVSDLNLIRTLEKFNKIAYYFKNEFDMINLGKAKFYLLLQIEHFPKVLFVHQSTYTKRSFKMFYMDNAQSLASP